MGQLVERAGLRVDDDLCTFIDDEVLPGSGVDTEAYWAGFAALVAEFAPRQRALLDERERLQQLIDRWHVGHRFADHDAAAYRDFLEAIGYIVPTGALFEVDTANVDPEISELAGPQLVVPISNARYTLNAANARWGSLYDALYGTDAIEPPLDLPGYDATRGAKVIAWVRQLLDEIVPLELGSHADVTIYAIADGLLEATFADRSTCALRDPSAFVGYRGSPDQPSVVLLEHHGLGIELVIDRADSVGADDRAGIADVVIE